MSTLEREERLPSFYKLWSNARETEGCVFDAADDWLLNGMEGHVKYRSSTIRITADDDEFIVFSDWFSSLTTDSVGDMYKPTAPTEKEAGEEDAEQFSGTC